MKKLFVSVLVLALGFSVKAQTIPQRKDDSSRVHSKHQKMKKSQATDFKTLNLSDAQKEELKTQRENAKKQIEDIKQNGQLTEDERKDKMKALREENKAKMESILTNEQKTQLQKIRTDRMGKGKMRTHNKNNSEKNRLNLTDAQAAQLKKNKAETMEKMKAIREDKSLSDEQKKEQMKELHKSRQENMKSILTADQLKKMKEMKHKKPEGAKDKPSLQSKG